MEVTFERLLSEIAEGIAVTDPRLPDNPLVYVNPAFSRLTGYSFDDVVGRNCRFLQGPDTDGAELDQLRQAIRDNQPCVVELLNYRKDGTRFWNNLSISPVLDANGEVIYLTGIQLDVTQRRELEEKQRQFVGDLAHELKTPIAALMGLTDTLERQPGIDQPTRQGINESMQSQIARLSNTVDSILELSRIDYTVLAAARQLLDFRDTIQESVDGMAPLAADSEVSISYTPPRSPVPILGDPWTLSMMVGNLLTNAVKYNNPGGRVDISLLAGDNSCQLVVADTGPGIDPKYHQMIFERFYRIDESRNRQNGGTGLGLSIVNEISRKHGGYVHVDSEPGNGSTFIVTLPVYSSGTAQS